MKDVIEKLISSNVPEDWLIAYYLIIEHYGSFEAYPRNEEQYLFIIMSCRIRKAIQVDYNEWRAVCEETIWFGRPAQKPIEIIIPELSMLR